MISIIIGAKIGAKSISNASLYHSLFSREILFLNFNTANAIKSIRHEMPYVMSINFVFFCSKIYSK